MNLVSIQNFERQVFDVEGIIISIRHDNVKEKILRPYPYVRRASGSLTVEDFLNHRIRKFVNQFEVHVLDFNNRQIVPGFYRLRELFLQTF
jgi:hypothetical protein